MLGGRLGFPARLAARRLPAAHVVALATALLLVLRLLFTHGRRGPVLFADESGYLGAARLLAGGEPFTMGSSPFYRSGYALLLAPLFRLGRDPDTTYWLVLLLNVVLCASVVPLAYLLLRRTYALSGSAAAAGAVVAGAFPSVSTASQVATSEALLFPLLLLWLLVVGRLAGSDRSRPVLTAAAVGGLAAALWAVHGRMIVVLAVTLAGMALLVLAGRLSAPALATGVGVLVLVVLLARLADQLVVQSNYDGRAPSEIASTLAALDGLPAWGSLLRNLVGSSWYVVVSGFGLLVVLAPEVRRCVGRLRRHDVTRETATTAASTLVLIGLLVVSAAWLVEPSRPDHLVYGRYVEPIMPPLLALAVGRLASSTGSLRWAVAVVLALSVMTAVLRAGSDLPGGLATRWSGTAMPFLTKGLEPGVLIAAGLVACAGAAMLALVAHRRPGAVWLAVLVLFAPVTAVSQLRLVAGEQDAVYPAGWTDPAAALPQPSALIGYDTSHFDRITVKVIQHFADQAELVPFDGASTAPPSDLVLGSRSWPQEHPDRPAAPLWRDPGRDQVLWQLDPL